MKNHFASDIGLEFTKSMKAAQGWYALDPFWEGGPEIVEKGLPHEELAPAWQILLLGDLSPTRHLGEIRCNIKVNGISPLSKGGTGPRVGPHHERRRL